MVQVRIEAKPLQHQRIPCLAGISIAADRELILLLESMAQSAAHVQFPAAQLMVREQIASVNIFDSADFFDCAAGIALG